MQRLSWAVCTGLFVLMCGMHMAVAGEDDSAAGIFYYSRTGNTRAVCEELQRVLDAELTEVHDRKNRSGGFGLVGGIFRAILGLRTKIDPASYDLTPYHSVIIASPVWAGSLTPAAHTFIKNNRFDGLRVVLVVTADSPVPHKRLDGYAAAAHTSGAEVPGVFQVLAADTVDGEKTPRTHAHMAREARMLAGVIALLVKPE